LRSIFAAALVLLLATTQASIAETLSVERQIEIITNYMNLTGQGSRIPESFALGHVQHAEEHIPLKCGMSAAMDFAQNRQLLDKDLMRTMGLAVFARPVLPLEYDSPANLFKIHYTKSDSNAVYQPDKDSDGDGVPDYVESVAVIFDSVYNHMIFDLGYPPPRNDSVAGGDSKFDVYLRDLDQTAYGYTTSDDPRLGIDTVYSISTYMELDNDFQRITAYKDRPLDAVRVTAAHEFFHAVQFGIDFKEFEIYGAEVQRRYWMEMSAVWMEEEMYDDINDYYFYLPYYYDDPRLSIQQFVTYSDLHPYGAVVFPIFLSEKFGNNIIHDIWTECGNLPGPNFLDALDSTLDKIYFGTPRSDTSALPEVFGEYAVWNFFTGLRADMAPDSVGFSEGENYPAIPNFRFLVIDDLPYVQPSDNFYNPDHLGATYIKLDQLQAFQRYSYALDIQNGSLSFDSLGLVDTTFWSCNIFLCLEYDTANCIGNPLLCCIDSVCIDSSRIFDPVIIEEGISDNRVWMNVDTLWEDSLVKLTHASGTRFVYDDPMGSPADTFIAVYDTIIEDSVYAAVLPFDLTFPQPWGVNVLLQLENPRDSFIVSDWVVRDSIRIQIPEPENFRSATLVLTPASHLRAYYRYDSNARRGTPMEIGMAIREGLVDSLRESLIDYNARNVPAELLVAYPNPAVTSKMTSPNLKLQYQVPTDNVSNYVTIFPRITMDIYSLAGEYVRFVDTVVAIDPINVYLGNDRTVLWEAEWDMNNATGDEVASGVYIILARMYSSAEGGTLLAEKTAKVAVIR
jgi:hypothetical protein